MHPGAMRMQRMKDASDKDKKADGDPHLFYPHPLHPHPLHPLMLRHFSPMGPCCS